jgi:hypothetical protein
MKFIFLLVASLVSVPGQTQEADMLNIRFPEIVRSYKDCILEITLSNKYNQEFIFPENYRVGEEDARSDLTIIIEKLNKNKYSYYRCNKSPFKIPMLNADSVRFTRQRIVKIIDSLEDLVCIERGHFRMRLEYRTFDEDHFLKTRVITRSNWVKFYVDETHIILSPYARMRLQER